MFRVTFMLRQFLILAACGLMAAPLFADDKPAPEPPAEKKEEKKDADKEPAPKETKGSVTIGAAKVNYIAKTGTMPVLKEDGGARANVFFVYYAATDADGKRLAEKSPGSRPVTFCFNGGPGSAAVWLHLGGLGPKKIERRTTSVESPSTAVMTVLGTTLYTLRPKTASVV